MLTKNRAVRISALAGILAVALMLTAVAASPAQSICDRYPDLPQCAGAVGPGGGEANLDDDAGLGPGGGDGTGAGTGNGASLPFTGYPLSTLVLLLLALLAAGLCLRGSLALRDRLRSSST